MFPSIPSWDGLHPLIVHFPIALLLIAPIFVVISVLWRERGRAFAWSALILMVLGTAGAIIAVSTGEAAGELAERTPAISATLERHEEMAETSRTIFIVLTLIYTLIVIAPLFVKKVLRPAPFLALNGAFLVIYCVATVYLANTAHQGGMLVHRYGVQAMVSPAPDVGAAQTLSREYESTNEHEVHDDDFH